MKRKHVIILILVILLAALGGGAFAYMGSVTKQETYFTGIQVENIDLSGLTKEEAKEKLNTYWDDILSQKVALTVGEKSKEVELKDLGLTYTNEDILEKAYQLGRDGNLIKNFLKVKSLEKNPETLQLDMAFDEETLETVLEKKTKKFQTKKKNATVTRKNGEFVIKDEVDGVAIDYDASQKALEEKISSDWKDRKGFSFEMTTTVDKAEYTAEMMSEIKDKLGSYSTSYSSSSSGRKKNVATGASFINGSVVYPGETFSVYEVVAPFTSERGYAIAGAYLNGKTVDSMGGGICQVSTTLYNAVLRAELEIVERSPHSMTVSYVPLSADAAIAGTYKDLKFKNNTDTPIYIEGYGDGGTLSFSIWGKETRDENRSIEFYSETISSTPSKEKEVKDPELEEGKTKIITKGHTGYKAKLWKIIYVDGKETDRVLVNESSYSASVTEIAVGTKKKEEKKEDNKTNNTKDDTTDDTTETGTESSTATSTAGSTSDTEADTTKE